MIPIAKPIIGPEEREAVDRVLQSGIIAQGPEVAKFEEEFAKECGVKYAVATNNGTTAGHLVMLANGIGPGDEVITTPFTFFATASVVMMAGATPVFVDVEEDGFCLDPTKVEAAITDKTKAIHPVHLYGELANIPLFLELSQKHDIILLEDSAQAHTANDWGGKAGSFGSSGWFSFYPTKNMTTSEGGMITTNDSKIAEKCKILRAHGMTAQYQHTDFGYNYRTEKREELRDYLAKNDIGSGIYYPSLLYHYPAMSSFAGDCPNSEKLIKEVLSLPIHPSLSDTEISKIISTIKSFFDNF